MMERCHSGEHDESALSCGRGGYMNPQGQAHEGRRGTCKVNGRIFRGGGPVLVVD